MPDHLLIVLSTVFHVRGGIPRFNQMLCLAIDQLATELDLSGTVICQDDTEDDYREAGRPWKQLEFVAGGGRGGLVRRSLRAAARERPDLMIVGLLGMTPLGVACLPFLRGGFGFIAHGTEVWEEPRFSRRVAGRRAAFAFAVSSHTAACLERSVGLPPSAIRLLPNALDPGFGSAPDDGPGRERPELLAVARLWAGETMKGVDHTLRAFARVGERHPRAILRIVGRGSDKPRLQRLASELGIGRRVIFEEDLADEELIARYRDCSIFVLPSGQEGFGIVFLEAMRFGKPCIGGAAGGTPDVIVDGESGFLVPFGELAPLELAMDRLLSDAGLRERMGRAGRERLEREFTFERYRGRLALHLRELLALD
jgi:glycosyltransferase involved in cell wall biosynthesis